MYAYVGNDGYEVIMEIIGIIGVESIFTITRRDSLI